MWSSMSEVVNYTRGTHRGIDLEVLVFLVVLEKIARIQTKLVPANEKFNYWCILGRGKHCIDNR